MVRSFFLCPCHSRLRGTSRERSQSIKKPGDKESDVQNRELLIILLVETRHGRTWVGDETADVRGSSVATCGGFGRRHDDSEELRGGRTSHQGIWGGKSGFS
jgi:hypothetical protein